jgi:hypothetical protein
MKRKVGFQELECCLAAGLFKEYKLCYIDDIPKTNCDYTPDAKEYRETEEWMEENRRREAKYKREGHMSSYDPEFCIFRNPILNRGSECMDYPNPDYIPGVQTLSAYFTPIPLEKQWGDDWDDAPYEHNAEVPYDDAYDENGGRKEIELLEVLFYLPNDGWNIIFPRDYGCGNSPFCVRDINAGAVAWIYYRGKEWKSGNGAVSIHAGCDPAGFMDKIRLIQNSIGTYESEDDEDI